MVVESTATICEKICSTIAKVISWAVLTMALTTFVVVVFRYGFNLGWVALQESIQYQHAFVFMLFAAHALGQDEHVRVDIFYRHWTEKRQALVNLFGTVFFLFPVCLTILLFSWGYVMESWRLLEGSKEAGGLPLVFVMKSLIPAFSLLMMLQGVAIILRAILAIQNKEGAPV